MAVKYTDEMLKELKSFEILDYDSAVKYAEKYNISPRSVTAKARAIGVEYKAKDPRSKAPKGRAKEDIVSAVYQHLGFALPSLGKMTSTDIELLEKYLADV